MTSKPDLKMAIRIMIAFLAIGIVCYAAFSPPVLGEGEEPLRIMLLNQSGPVLFAHTSHIDDYGIECESCHHTDDDTYNCSECHEKTGDEDVPSRADSLHAQCIDCHEEYDLSVDCTSCHAPQ